MDLVPRLARRAVAAVLLFVAFCITGPIVPVVLGFSDGWEGVGLPKLEFILLYAALYAMWCGIFLIRSLIIRPEHPAYISVIEHVFYLLITWVCWGALGTERLNAYADVRNASGLDLLTFFFGFGWPLYQYLMALCVKVSLKPSDFIL
jgi:hypothetical protein